jgi:hypothetical protein
MSTPEANEVAEDDNLVVVTTHQRVKQRRKPPKRNFQKGKEKEIDTSLVPKSPKPKAICPYQPKSELEDSQLRFLIYHCELSPPPPLL